MDSGKRSAKALLRVALAAAVLCGWTSLSRAEETSRLDLPKIAREIKVRGRQTTSRWLTRRPG